MLKSQPTVSYVHPINLLKSRLSSAYYRTFDLVELTLDNYELSYEQRGPGQTWYTTALRKDHYNDHCRERYNEARKLLELARPAAIGISEWLRFGMGLRAGTFETELRAALAGMASIVYDFPALPLYPVLEKRYASWKQDLEKILSLSNELDHVAIESTNPLE